MNNSAMYKLGCGLYVLSAREGEKDNGCITNTAMQVTASPNRITIAVNKQNLTHDMVLKTGVFNLSVLSEATPFALFERFGFQSGRTADKFSGILATRSENGVLYLPEQTSAFLSGKVLTATDLGTHTLFLAEVTDGEVLSALAPATYAYYQSSIKPKPQATPKKGYRCKICGYIYEGESLPPDFICPVCKHGAEDFEKIV
ncbi:MAG: flavin reductase [Pygmaiobacter sp.]